MMSPPQPDVEDLVSPETPNAWIFYDVPVLNLLNPLGIQTILMKQALENGIQLHNRYLFITEKNELREEKQRLKTEKDNLKWQVKALGSEPGFVPQAHAIATPFSTPSQVVGCKLLPLVGYPGVSMWQFLPHAAVDTSQDHILRPPVA
ncbi:hypothetical protein V6N11_025826 [Hibiscus sabdariffa]|uniref:Uncharacterized protein n=1 Tax=Hibiscus sabdariffa TaxID=183260 RepID=A0ABR2STT9_9ROSI